MSLSRQHICQSAAARLAACAPGLASMKALIGFDGFVDSIIDVVDKRQDTDHYEPCRTIAQFAGKIAAAAGESSNYELVIKKTKLGGNGPIMANAMACAGMAVTYVGGVGYPTVHPVYAELQKNATVISMAETSYTDALEFQDGKLMLGRHQYIKEVNWDNLVSRVGLARMIALARQSRLIGMVNWTMLTQMNHMWAKLTEEVLPHLDRRQTMAFIDLCDPEKRTAPDIAHMLALLPRMQGCVDVILGLNLKECIQIAQALGLPPTVDDNAAICGQADAIRRKLDLACVVVHPRRGAAAAIAGETAWFDGPFVQQPLISTGAGDHFNAGFCTGRVLGLSLEESLCTGVATSGYYVRQAASPSAGQLADFIRQLPAPER